MDLSSPSKFPGRPRRLEQLWPGARALYFVTFNTFARRRLLATPAVHDSFRVFCQRAHDEHGIAVGRYVLMPDHVHLFVAMPATGITLGRWVQVLRSIIGRRLVADGHDQPHWQPGFFDHVLRSDQSYAQKWEYVQMNPVRAGVCEAAEDWPSQGEIIPIRR